MKMFIVTQEITVTADTHEAAAKLAREYQKQDAFCASGFLVTNVGTSDCPPMTKLVMLEDES